MSLVHHCNIICIIILGRRLFNSVQEYSLLYISFYTETCITLLSKQAVAELGQAQVKLADIVEAQFEVEVGVELGNVNS